MENNKSNISSNLQKIKTNKSNISSNLEKINNVSKNKLINIYFIIIIFKLIFQMIQHFSKKNTTFHLKK